jgi:hypothetical protein
MEIPKSINQAVMGIWATIALSAIGSLINKWLGSISMGEFVFTVFLYALVCILPYKISKGSNPARYVYLIFFIITILLMLAGMGEEIPKLDFVLSIILIPVEIFIIYRLFQKESSVWFS